MLEKGPLVCLSREEEEMPDPISPMLLDPRTIGLSPMSSANCVRGWSQGETCGIGRL